MTEIADNAASMANRKLPKGFMAYTTERRLSRMKRAAAILKAAGIDLEANGHTGLINDFAEDGLEVYLRWRLEAAGKSRRVIDALMAQLREE